MEKVDTTVFIKTKKNDIFTVQIYIYNTIFCATNISLCEEFSNCKSREFGMNMTGELKFFLGLQIKQINDGIIISQTKYIMNMLKKFEMEEVIPVILQRVHQSYWALMIKVLP